MKLFRLFFTSLFLTCILALLIPASGVFAKSAHVTQPARPFTSPSCYGDGLPHNNPPIQGCDGLDQSICNVQYLENVKPIGSSDGEGQIGQLEIFYSPTNGNGCNAWHTVIYITHTGCYNATYDAQTETGSDYSQSEATTPHQVCKGQFYNTPMVGDWQPGGCYYGQSTVADASGNPQYTSTVTFCYQGTH